MNRPRATVVGLTSLLYGLCAIAAADEVCEIRNKRANLDFTIEDIHGNEVHLADYEGHVILLDFWATWCAPCLKEIPYFIELYESYRDEGFVVLGFSVNDGLAELEPFVAELGMSYPVLVGKDRHDIREAYGPLVGYPTSFVIARDGGICMRHTGLVAREDLEKQIKALL